MGGAYQAMTSRGTRSTRNSGPRPGELFAIPRKKGGYYIVVHVASNRFGEAFGILDGHSHAPVLPAGRKLVPVGYPVYTGKALVVNGRWQRVGAREEARELFPPTPDVFHSKEDNLANPSVGRFGSGETLSGELRDLSEIEARDLGLGGRYRQLMLEEEFEAFVQETLG